MNWFTFNIYVLKDITKATKVYSSHQTPRLLKLTWNY